MRRFLLLLALCLPLLVISAGASEDIYELEPVLDPFTDSAAVYLVTAAERAGDGSLGYAYRDGMFYRVTRGSGGNVWTPADGDFSYVMSRVLSFPENAAVFADAVSPYILDTDTKTAIANIESYFSKNFGTSGYSGNLVWLGWPSSQPAVYAAPGFTVSQLLAHLNDNLSYHLEATSFLSAGGDVVNSWTSLGHVTGQGFLGLSSVLRDLLELEQTSMQGDFSNFLAADGSLLDGGGQSILRNMPLVNVVQNGFAGLGTLQTNANTYFSNVLGTTGFSGSVRMLSSDSAAPSSTSVSRYTLPTLLNSMNTNLSTHLEASSYLSSSGFSSSGSRGVGYITGQGFLGMRSLLSGSETDNVYTFTGYSNDFVNDTSLDIDSKDTDYTGLGPLLNGALSQLSYQVGLLDTVFASPQDLQMKQDVDPNMDAVSDSFLKSDSPGSVSTSDISDMASVSQGAASMVNTGVSMGQGFQQLDDPSLFEFFTSETASNLHNVPAVSSEDEEEGWTHYYEDQMLELWSILGK